MEADPGGVAELEYPDGAVGVDQMALGEGGEGDVVKVHSASERVESVCRLKLVRALWRRRSRA